MEGFLKRTPKGFNIETINKMLNALPIAIGINVQFSFDE